MTSAPSTPQPHSLQAEKTVLGALLLDPDAMLRIRGQLCPEDFYDPVYRTIYEACEKLFDSRQPIDFVTVSEALSKDEKINSIGGAAFLADLATGVPTSSHIENYARTVHEKAGHRALIKTGNTISSLGFDEEQSFVDLLGKAQEKVLSLSQQGIDSRSETLGEVTERRYSVFAEVKEGGDSEERRRVRTGFSNVDYFFNGFEPQTLNIVAGRPAMGKTALLLDMAINAAKMYDKRSYIFSFEMSKEQLSDRLASGRLGLSMWKMQRGEITDAEMHQFGKVVDEFHKFSLHIDDDPNSSMANIRAKALRHQLEHGLDVLFIDYLQLISPPSSVPRNANRTEVVSAISRDLKVLARELNVPVIVGCQLSRQTENRPKSIPQLSDLRDSGTIEQDADNVLQLWREGYYEPDCEDPDVTTIFIRKNRQGQVGEAELMFLKETTTFVPVDRKHEEGESGGNLQSK